MKFLTGDENYIEQDNLSWGSTYNGQKTKKHMYSLLIMWEKKYFVFC